MMRTVTSLDELLQLAGEFRAGTAVAVGKFDGVHVGHQAIIASLKRVAAERGLETVVFTFANNPLSVLRPEVCPRPLASPEQRLDELEAEGVDNCVMIEFDREFAAIESRDFVERHLVEAMNAKHIILGTSFRFGHRGLGDAELLRELGKIHGFTVEVVESVGIAQGEMVSSTRIREAALAGNVALAAAMLGRPYAVRGTVVHGDARGRDLGFPTANLGPSRDGRGVEGLVPADGVYAGTAVVDGTEYAAAISVGVNLTFEPEGEPRVEAYLLGFSGDLYGKAIEVRFTERIRDMVAFTGVDALIARMQQDVAETQEIYARTAQH